MAELEGLGKGNADSNGSRTENTDRYARLVRPMALLCMQDVCILSLSQGGGGLHPLPALQKKYPG